MISVHSRTIRTIARVGAMISRGLLASCGDSAKPKTPVDIIYAGGNGQSGVAGLALSAHPNARVVADDGSGVSGVAVTWVAAVGGGSVTTATATTDADGKATPGAWIL